VNRRQLGGFWLFAASMMIALVVDLSLEQLKALPHHEQITQHFCIQGWSGVAKWGGVSMQSIVDLVAPRSEAMLTELEKRLMARGVHRLSALLAEGETAAKAFQDCGYETRDLTYFERVVSLQPQEVGLLEALGGRMLPRNPWQTLAGMEHEKELIERRVVLPLSTRTSQRSTESCRPAQSSCLAHPGRARPRLPRRWPPAWTGRSSRSSHLGWPGPATAWR
jgi:Oxidoreductase molybdopterin binding domain